ncbi:MAG: tetratricopeptide repeat protein [Trueperaceae bacterium]
MPAGKDAATAYATGQEPGRLDQAIELLSSDPEQALSLAEAELAETADSRQTARALLVIGSAAYRLERPQAAVEPLSEAHELYLTLNDEPRRLEALMLLARTEHDLGRYREAAERFGEVLVVARRLGDEVTEAEALNLQAGAFNSQGEYVAALERLTEALEIAQRLDSAERQANFSSNIGLLHLQLGDYSRALESLKAAYELIRVAAPGTRSEAANLISLGRVYLEMEEPSRAQEFFTLAHDVGQQAGDSTVEAASLNHLASICCSHQDWQGAGRLYRDALEVARRMGNRGYEIDNLDGLGQVHSALGEHQDAGDAYHEALTIAREIGDLEGETDALLNLGRGSMAMGHFADAIAPLEQGLELAKRLERRRSRFEAHELLAEAYEHEGDLVSAIRHHREFYRVEKAVFNEESEDRVRRLTVQFELERARSEAEAYRVRTELAQRAQEEAEERVRARTLELEEAQLEIVTRLAIAAEYRDDETGEHTWRVGRNAAAIAARLGWSDDEVKLISVAARLHDVGKIGIRDAVLLKPGKLSSDEYELMRRHTMIGGRILSGGHSRLLRMAEEISFAHHERWDGKGYPLGLVAEEIPLSARIVAVADVLDALSHARPYKRPWPVADALAEVRRYSGHQFDPKVVAACMDVFNVSGGLSPVQEAPRPAGEGSTRPVPSTIPMRYRFEKVLAERTRELEQARREAETAARRMQVMAFSDTLTGLGNRRAFEADLDAEVVRALRHSDRIAVLTIDLDDLKVVNDREGHERGDDLLRAFAGAIHLKLKEMGRVYRVGGDEFAVILVHLGMHDVESARSKVREAIAALRESGFPGMMASAGLAVLPEEAGSVADLLRLSDQRMYQDKMVRKASSGMTGPSSGGAT